MKPDDTIWILGTGRFGRLAAERLAVKEPGRHLVLVDPEGAHFDALAGPGRRLFQADGVQYVTRHLVRDGGPQWIVPALPVHLVAEWLLARVPTLRRIPPPQGLAEMLPNAMVGDSGDIYVSHADFLCPDDCAEPAACCTVTGKKRPRNMFDLLGDLDFPDVIPHVIRSRQLRPGVGGLRPQDMWSLLDKAASCQGDLFVATACRCHGVVTPLRAAL